MTLHGGKILYILSIYILLNKAKIAIVCCGPQVLGVCVEGLEGWDEQGFLFSL